jgi:hypothetical protein
MLWAVTPYFNPARYRSRLATYREYRRRLTVPLLAIELGFDGRFELGDADAEILVRVGDGDVMWQKERLVNLALAKLPAACSAVAVVDCDVVFTWERWQEEALTLLERFPVVQAFTTVHYLGEKWRPGDALESGVAMSQPGIAALPPAAQLPAFTARTRGAPAIGFAWVFRRDLLERHGLYDACIIGGGDKAMLSAALDRTEPIIEFHGMNRHQVRRYRRWAEPFFESVQGRVGALEGDIYHLWHGEMEHRYTQQRHLGLAPFDFDPDHDIAPGAQGAWRWNSDKPGLHAYLRDYFALRREDG